VAGLLDTLRKRLCCPPPPAVTGVVAATGGGSGEVFVAWDPVPGGAAASYRVYRRAAQGVWRPLAAVTPAATDPGFPGKVVLLDFAGTFPGGGSGGGDEDAAGVRHYVVAAVSAAGAEGPWSAQVGAAPP
jgi:hypothetical protein